MTLAENIIACLDRATPAEIEDGITWYPRAHEFARSLDANNVYRASGVIAALSPRKEWGLNMRMAKRTFDTGIASGNTGAMNRVAQSIFDGMPAMDALKGDKTRQFCTAIARAGDSDIAVIDRHAYDVAVATIHTDKTRPSITKNVYRRFAEAYYQASIESGFSVAELQAITWVTWKRLKAER